MQGLFCYSYAWRRMIVVVSQMCNACLIQDRQGNIGVALINDLEWRIT